MMSLLVPRQIFVLVVLLMLALSASSLRVPSLSRFLRLSRLQQSTAAEQEGATAYIECAAGPEIFQKTVIDASQENPVVVDFYADWCGPCKLTAPIFKKVAEEFKTSNPSITFVKVDTDCHEETVETFSIQGLPLFGVFVKGKMVANYSGALNGKKLTDLIEKAITKK